MSKTGLIYFILFNVYKSYLKQQLSFEIEVRQFKQLLKNFTEAEAGGLVTSISRVGSV
jgi:hypothetical protein